MRILMIEDDEAFCEMVRFALAKEGYTVDVCHEGDDGLRWMREQSHDLVLLDRMLPRMDGGALLRKARAEHIHTPVLMMTALGSIEDRIEGLDLGADDYIVKPFHTGELLARIRAVSRRPRAWGGKPQVEYMGLVLDPFHKTLDYGGKQVSLSKREAALLELLMKNGGSTVGRASIFAYVWGPDAGVEDGNLDNYIHFIRQRLRAVDSPVAVVTIRYTGYCLREKQSDESL